MAILATVLTSLLAAVVFFGIMLLPSRYVKHSPATKESTRVHVLVLGDIGRSPRMNYHARSIASHGGYVDLIGYDESPILPDLLSNERVEVYGLATPPSALNPLADMDTDPRARVRHSACTLVAGPEPPSIPTLAIAMIICFLRNTHLMIDWHNYGWTILAGTRGTDHPFVRISKAYECVLGRAAPTANITVTHAMERQLKEAPYHIRTPILTLHDRPADIFKPLHSEKDRLAFLEKLPETKDMARDIVGGRAKLIVSSTSWTPDEDFSLLLDGLVTYAKVYTSPIVAIITGKGPQKAHYLDRIAQLQKDGQLPNIRIDTAWLSMEDYATLLSCADLGVCLHMSSSGVDLPMKVVDMFGSGLPVAAYANYESFGELVKEGVNGCGFETADELAATLGRLFTEDGSHELKHLREGACKEGSLRWDEEWDRVIGRVIGVIE
ncbi:glycosyl transferase group 1 [Apiospora kogelbergensis]|uniref:glycosyl transferase group 1 n=1 Tax=Apiospora kogelbergensis TaxID=1337665 RepID=UPI00312D028F